MHRLTDTEGISANQAYLIHVVALAKHGISLGSIETEIYVKDGQSMILFAITSTLFYFHF